MNTNTPTTTKKRHTVKMRPSQRVFEIALAVIEKKDQEIDRLKAENLELKKQIREGK